MVILCSGIAFLYIFSYSTYFQNLFLIYEAANKTNKQNSKPNQAKKTNRQTQEQVPSWVKGKNGKKLGALL